MRKNVEKSSKIDSAGFWFNVMPSKIVNTHEAKTHFSRLLRRVAAGEEVTIANRGVPMARLVPVRPEKAKRFLGMFLGQFSVPEDFDAPLPDEILDLFEGRRPRKRKKP
jgi:prevent-host-death family protein